MLDPTGYLPGAVPPRVLSALRGGAASAAPSPETPERVAADAALAKALGKAAELAELRARYAADTADNAWLLKAATLDVTQALLAAYAHLRDRVDVG